LIQTHFDPLCQEFEVRFVDESVNRDIR
jgi:hypothetical protein